MISVMDYGAFVDVGVKKDGLLRNDAFGECQRLAAGDEVTVLIASVDIERQKIRLRSSRPVASQRTSVPQEHADAMPSKVAKAEMVATERMGAAEAQVAAERAKAEASVRSRIEAIEAMMVQDAFDREAAAATARVSAGLVLPAAAVARGMPVPPRQIPANDPLEVLVEKHFAGGRVRVLYRMPWPAARE